MSDFVAPTTLLDPQKLPSWLKDGHWTWQGHTTVLDSADPDGRIVSKSGEEFGLDLQAAFNEANSELSSFEINAARVCWETGSVAVIADEFYGCVALLVPVVTFDANTFVEAIRRFAILTGIETNDLITTSVDVCLWDTSKDSDQVKYAQTRADNFPRA